MSDTVNTGVLRELATHWGFDWQAPLIFAAADEIEWLRERVEELEWDNAELEARVWEAYSVDDAPTE